MKTKILIADDSLTIRMFVELTFIGENYLVFSCETGMLALDYIQKEKPHIVLYDAYLPDLSGYEFCYRVSRDKSLPPIAILLLIPATEKENFDFEQAISCGAMENGFLMKPFNKEALVQKIQELSAQIELEAVAPQAILETIPDFTTQVLEEIPEADLSTEIISEPELNDYKSQITGLEEVLDISPAFSEEFISEADQIELLEDQPILEEQTGSELMETPPETMDTFISADVLEQDIETQELEPEKVETLEERISPETFLELAEEKEFVLAEKIEPESLVKKELEFDSATLMEVVEKVKEEFSEKINSLIKERIENFLANEAPKIVAEIAWDVVPELALQILTKKAKDFLEQAEAPQAISEAKNNKTELNQAEPD